MMSHAFHQFLFAVLVGFALALLVDSQNQTGFISIDCGLPNNSSYTETTTGINYVSDSTFIDTGESRYVSTNSDSYQPYWYVRSFPQGVRNCYKINVKNGTKYLIRTGFQYENYDGQNKPPEFELHLGASRWDTLNMSSEIFETTRELIHVPLRDYIHICLVNTNKGVPFISLIELRPLPNGCYPETAGSLANVYRKDTGLSIKNYAGFIRYPDDIYDRIWQPDYVLYTELQLTISPSIMNNSYQNIFQIPSVIMSTAVMPKNASASLDIYWSYADGQSEYYMYLYFAELEKLRTGQPRRNLYIVWSGLPQKPFVLPYLVTYPLYNQVPINKDINSISVFKTNNSTLPPILNAYEIYAVKNFSELETSQEDVDAITNIKLSYKISEPSWQGDPCSPQVYKWKGLDCIYHESALPRLISLNLSSSGLRGQISPFIAKLTMIQVLDLSNNTLTGPIPDFLSQMPNLNVLNLEKNKLTGSVPAGLIDRRNTGVLSLSLCENPNLSKFGHVSCKLKKHSIVIPVVVSTVGAIILLLTAVAIWWRCKDDEIDDLFEAQGRKFTKSEIDKITSNSMLIGRGGFGEVYHSTLENDTQVAVKILNLSSSQGSEEFQNEVKLLMRVHHRNLVSLIGYCHEGDTMALVYEYVANGNLQQHISVTDVPHEGLTWQQRLQIAVDAARGLEYLHDGCKPPILHRDLKPSNILINETLQAKIADFGISKALATESATHALTDLRGTQGYLDPEYCTTGQLTRKSDAYSFGIVLLELITGRPAIITDLEPVHINVSSWVRDKFARLEIESIVDSRIQGTYKLYSALKAIETALACVSRTPAERPEISFVYDKLKECLNIEMATEESDVVRSDEGILSNSNEILDSQL